MRKGRTRKEINWLQTRKKVKATQTLRRKVNEREIQVENKREAIKRKTKTAQ